MCSECDIVDCIQCTYDDEYGLEICAKCDDGYSVDKYGLCRKCSRDYRYPCIQCKYDGNNVESCAVCDDEYYVDGDGDCEKCEISGCLECVYDDVNGIVECLLCVEGQRPRLSGEECKECGDPEFF